MKFASCLLVFSLLFLEPSTAQCTTICATMETCEAEGKLCDACDGTANCALVTDTSGYCTGCNCPVAASCTDGDQNGTTCSLGNPPAGGAESCDECHWDTNACVADPAYCDGECLSCEEACAACEAEGCVYTETVGDGRECVCPLDCQVCDPTCNSTDEICHPNTDEDACMCVPDCDNQQDKCGTIEEDCETAGDTCELNDDYTDCQCAQAPPPITCIPADCTGCTDDESCKDDGSSACACVLECDLGVNDTACGGGCTDPELCHPNTDEDACMCVPDCDNQQDKCGTIEQDCEIAGETCELNDDYTDCQCAQGPPPPTDCAPADCTGCTDDEICELDGSSACACVLECDLGVNDTACGGGCTDPALTCDDDLDMTGCMCVPDCGAGGTNCGSGGYDCESVSDTCELTSDKTDCECSQGPPPTTTEDSTTSGSVANAGVIGAFLVVMLLSLAAA